MEKNIGCFYYIRQSEINSVLGTVNLRVEHVTMLWESVFVVNHCTIPWLVAAGLYTAHAVIADLRPAKSPAGDTDKD